MTSTMRSFNRPTRRRLQKLGRKRPAAGARVRIRVVLKAAAGVGCNAAACELGCVASSSVRIVARFALEGEPSLLEHRSERGTRRVSPGSAPAGTPLGSF